MKDQKTERECPRLTWLELMRIVYWIADSKMSQLGFIAPAVTSELTLYELIPVFFVF